MKPLRASLMIGVIIACLAFDAAEEYAATVYDGAVAYWNFDNQNADDSIGTNHGVVNGATWTSQGKVGGAYIFDETNGYINVPYPVLSDSPADRSFTVVYFFRPNERIDRSVTKDITIVTNNNGWSGNKYQIFGHFHPNWPGQLRSYWYYWTSAVTQRDCWEANTWYQYAVVYENNVMTVYVNGAADTELRENWYYFKQSNGGNWTFGVNIAYPSEEGKPYFNGLIDEVAIWNTALTSEQITHLYNEGLIGGGVINTLGFSQDVYDTDAIGALADLYAAQTGSVEIGGITWRYLSGNLPGDTGYDIGDSWTYNGRYYIKLGSGLEGEPVPEPATVVGILGAVIAIGYRRYRNRRV
ncbi:MAG: LamG domain-containing protein [Candidatus Omnitrophica bacterium]|nr:LamG domain-containing protein [Candidatus Omnitrophota bacterium]